jgi:hypothetical protein
MAPIAKELWELERKMAFEFGWADCIGPYSALPSPTSIRVLDIVPRTKDPIQCSFKIVDLDKLPVYIALSYTWGNPRTVLPPGEDIETDQEAMNKRYAILCGTQVIEISANCHNFMLQFQLFREKVHTTDNPLRFSAAEVQHIWIDAICINQDSVAERSSQVQIMDRIYRQAQKVIVWLGQEDALTREGFRTLALLARAAGALHSSRKDTSDSLLSSIGTMANSPLLKSIGIPMISWKQWQAVVAMYRRAWFSRSWTIQEFALAREVIIMCGTLMSNWSLLSIPANFLVTTQWINQIMLVETPGSTTEIPLWTPDPKLSSGEDLKTIFETKNSVDAFYAPIRELEGLNKLQSTVSRQRWGNSDTTIPLQAVLGILWKKSNTVPADCIYAYLGLVPKTSYQGLSVDYTRSTQETYVQATWAMMKSTRSLRILSHIENAEFRVLRDLPSWVPDYSVARTIRPLDPGRDFDLGGHSGCYFDASRGTLFDPITHDTLSRSLAVTGLFLTSVENLGYTSERSGWQHADVACLLHTWPLLKYIRHLPQDTFWRTLISDMDVWENSYPASNVSIRDLFGMCTFGLSRYHNAIERSQSAGNLSGTYIAAEKDRLRKAFETYTLLGREHRFLNALLAVEPNIPFTITMSYEEIYQYIRGAIEKFMMTHLYHKSDNGFKYIGDMVQLAMSGVYIHMNGRNLFTTANKGFGKGPLSTRRGDEVWILRGGKVPYVLRPLGNATYKLVGEAYMHGIMQGEAIVNREKEFKTLTLV